jgi:hypothetical protein
MSSEFDDVWEGSEDATTEDLKASLQTKFLSGTSLGGETVRLTIEGVKNMPLKDPKTGVVEKKLTVGFTNGQLYPTNKTNRKVLSDALGPDPQKWPGANVSARGVPTSMGAGVCLFDVIGKPSMSKKSPPPPSDLDDQIPPFDR